MPHGYYDLKGGFVETDTKEAATLAWREERGYSNVGWGGSAPPPDVPASTAPDMPTANATANVTSYNVQDIQGRQQTSFRAPHLDVLYDQWKANLDVDRPWDWIEKPLSYDVQSIQSLAGSQNKPVTGDPLGIGGSGTPAELAAGGGWGVSSAYWREDADSMALMKAGQTPLYGADLAALATANYINNFGYPSFITPYVKNKFGWGDEKMEELGYIQEAGGNWIRTERAAPTTPAGGGGGGGGGGITYYGGGGGGGGGGYAGSSYSRLVNWRIGV